MRMCDKIKFMRQAKELSQEQMAEKLGLSLNGYANIERGETDVASLRIKQIAEALDANFMELVSFGERNVVFLTGSENHNVSNILHISNTSNDLEKAHLIIEAQQTEITYLKEIIELMKAKQAN
ncbi:MAG: helix-turn-helix transcriptional regulator [Methylococcaceae bacterium]|jgi:transcriptional regulator with XRE-family HTH domain